MDEQTIQEKIKTTFINEVWASSKFTVDEVNGAVTMHSFQAPKLTKKSHFQFFEGEIFQYNFIFQKINFKFD